MSAIKIVATKRRRLIQLLLSASRLLTYRLRNFRRTVSETFDVGFSMATKQKSWGQPQKVRCNEKFDLWKSTEGRKGWDPHKFVSGDNNYMLLVCRDDDIVWAYAAGSKGGHEKNKDSEKLFRGGKNAATAYLKVLPKDWERNEDFIKDEQAGFEGKYKYEKVYDPHSKAFYNVELGQGTFGTVYKAKAKDGTMVAIKIPKHMTRKAVEDGSNEIQIWNQLFGSPFLLKLLDYYLLRVNKNSRMPVLCTITPFVDGGTLDDYIGEMDKNGLPDGIPNRLVWSCLVAKMLMLGVHHMHRHQVVNRDIKTDNILVVKSPGLGRFHKIQIIDLGTAKRLAPTPKAPATAIGTPFFVAPEVRDGMYGKRMFEVDVYSIGAVILPAAVGQWPDKTVDPYTQKGMWFDNFNIGQVCLDHSDNHLVELACKMIQEEASERIGLPEAIYALNYVIPKDPESSAYMQSFSKDFVMAYSKILGEANLSFIIPDLESHFSKSVASPVENQELEAQNEDLASKLESTKAELEIANGKLEAVRGIVSGVGETPAENLLPAVSVDVDEID